MSGTIPPNTPTLPPPPGDEQAWKNWCWTWMLKGLEGIINQLVALDGANLTMPLSARSYFLKQVTSLNKLVDSQQSKWDAEETPTSK